MAEEDSVADVVEVVVEVAVEVIADVNPEAAPVPEFKVCGQGHCFKATGCGRCDICAQESLSNALTLSWEELRDASIVAEVRYSHAGDSLGVSPRGLLEFAVTGVGRSAPEVREALRDLVASAGYVPGPKKISDEELLAI